MQYAHKHMFPSYVIRRDLVQVESVKCVTLSGVVYHDHDLTPGMAHFQYYNIVIYAY
jgi:hypothetical protein